MKKKKNVEEFDGSFTDDYKNLFQSINLYWFLE